MQRLSLTVDGRDRRFVQVGEPGDDLLLFFHGSLQSGPVMRRFTNNTFDAVAPCVVYPDGIGRHFNDARAALPVQAREENVDDVAFTRALVEHYAPKRVFACGFSNGGQMVLRLLFDAPGLLDAAVVFASTLGAGDNHAPSNPDSAYLPTPVLLMHGTADKLALYAGGEAGGPAHLRRGPMLGAEANAEYLASLNGAGPMSVTQPYADVKVRRWEGAAPVELWTVDGMGHVIPSGSDVDPRLGANTSSFIAADVVRDFLARV